MKSAAPPALRIAFLSLAAWPGFSAEEPWDRVPPLAESLLHESVFLDAGHEWQLRLGGQARSMMEAYRNPDFGLSGVDEDVWLHHRVETFMALDHENDFSLAAGLSWGDMEGKKGDLAPVDQDDPDLLQLYAQERLEFGHDRELVLRAGRQILYYGSGRLLAAREGANQRLSHDAVRLSWRQNGWQVDAIVATPVKILPGAFDNHSHPHDVQLWGLYATGPSCFGENHGVDLYYLGLHQDHAAYAQGEEETRHTFGTRCFGHTERWIYNHEFILQSGTLGQRDVFAGAASLGLGRKFTAMPLQPVLGLRADLISGGQGQSEINTFNPLFQANNYFNEGGFVTPSNLYNINPRLTLQLRDNISLDLGVNFLWRFDSGDAIYGAPFHALTGAAPHGERYLGTAYNLELSWDPHPSIEVSLGLTHHEAGRSLTVVGGKSEDYLQIATRIQF